MEYPIKLLAIRVQQPLGDFFVTSIPANILLDVTYSDPLRIRETSEDSYSLTGAQRKKNEKRIKEIGKYIESLDAAFPNSIIIASNYREDGLLEENDNIRWKLQPIDKEKKLFEIEIPSPKKLASIIDGQHRVAAFQYSNNDASKFELLCAIYFELPDTLQAYLFATINYNQKSVPKSLAYELFGVNLEDEPNESWSPEKAAIFLTRKLNRNYDSPFHNHILISAQIDELLKEKIKETWSVSTATIVDGIMKLYSKNPKLDKVKMHKIDLNNRKREVLPEDDTPLRAIYKLGNDLAIYTIIKNYFKAAEKVLFNHSEEGSFIKKTIGIQALFSFLYIILESEFKQKKDISIGYFSTFLEPVQSVPFEHLIFPPSGVGKKRILDILKLGNGFIKLEDINDTGLAENYRQILNNNNNI